MYLPYVTHFSPFLTFSLLLSTLLSSTFLSNPTLMMTWTLSGLQFPRPAVTRKEELSLVKYQSLNASHGQPVVPLCLSAVNGVVLTTPPVHSSCNNRLFFIVKLTAEHFAKKCLIKMQHRLSFSFFCTKMPAGQQFFLHLDFCGVLEMTWQLVFEKHSSVKCFHAFDCFDIQSSFPFFQLWAKVSLLVLMWGCNWFLPGGRG